MILYGPSGIHHAVKTVRALFGRIADSHDPVRAITALLDHEGDFVTLGEPREIDLAHDVKAHRHGTHLDVACEFAVLNGQKIALAADRSDGAGGTTDAIAHGVIGLVHGALFDHLRWHFGRTF